MVMCNDNINEMILILMKSNIINIEIIILMCNININNVY